MTERDLPGDPARQETPLLPQGQPRRPRRWVRYAFWGVSAALLLVVGAALGGYLYLQTQTTIKAELLPANRPQDRLFGWPLRLKDRVNILLIGVDVTLDNRRRVLNVSRSDTLILVSFDPERRRIFALSLPRDTKAVIPGRGTDKINAAYAYGGLALTIKTVESFLGVRIPFFVKLGPDSFRQVIDALGGLDVDVEKDMKYTDTWAGYRIDLKKGLQHLNGEQVTGYIRFRYDALGDIGRVERQRKIMKLLVRQLKQPSTVAAAPRLLRAFAEHTQTNLTATELLSLGLFVMRSGGESAVLESTLPGRFAPSYWQPEFDKIRPLVADWYYGVSEPALIQTPIEIQNGSGLPGLGGQVAARLQFLGFRSVTVKTVRTRVEATTIIDRGADRNVVHMVAAALRRALIKREASALRSGNGNGAQTAKADGRPASAATRSGAAPKPGITILLGKDAAKWF